MASGGPCGRSPHPRTPRCPPLRATLPLPQQLAHATPVPPPAADSPSAGPPALPKSPQWHSRKPQRQGSEGRGLSGSCNRGAGAGPAAHVTAARAGPTASAMGSRALVCWALLLALGLCRAHRARPRNVLLILGECVPADPPPPRASLFTAACCRPAPAAVSVDPSPEAFPVSSHRCPQTLLWQLLAEGGRAVSPIVGTAGWAPPFSTPLLQQALTPNPLACQCPSANPAGPQLGRPGAFQNSGPQIPDGISQEKGAGASVPRGQPECPGALISSP